MTGKKLLLVASLILALLGGGAQAADIRMIKMDGGKHAISLQGRIEPEDYRAVVSAARHIHELDAVPYNEVIVWLNSGGGDFAGLAIGEFINFNAMQTYVSPHASCDSLCAFIWLAGRKRWVHQTASIAWHRSYVQPGFKSARVKTLRLTASWRTTSQSLVSASAPLNA